MRKRRKACYCKDKQNNKGISLVELIVAITILSIIVVPLLHAFVTAAHTSVKAKRIAQATEVGRNIMEGLEPYRLSQIAYQFNYPSEGFSLFPSAAVNENDICELNAVVDASENATGGFVRVTKAEELPDNLTNPEESITSSIIKTQVGSKNYYLKEKNRYYFKAENLAANGAHYDALISIDPTRHSQVLDPDNPNENTDGINTLEFAAIKQMDALHDGLSTYRDVDYRSSVIANIQDTYNSAQRAVNEDWEDVALTEADIVRSITVDVSNLGAATLVNVAYQYSYGSIIYPENPMGTVYSFSIYDNSENTDCELQNVYLFIGQWNPSAATDTITINNTTRQAVCFYLIEQKEETGVDTGYRPTIRLNQSNPNKSKICTNLSVDESHYYYNGLSTEQARSNMEICGLTDAQKSNRMYDVTVTVYPEGSFKKGLDKSEAIITLTGGMLD